MDDQTLHGKLPAIVAHRSLPRPVIAVVGRTDISTEAADEMGLTAVHALTDHTSENPAGDPKLSRSLLTELARTIPLPPTGPSPRCDRGFPPMPKREWQVARPNPVTTASASNA